MRNCKEISLTYFYLQINKSTCSYKDHVRSVVQLVRPHKSSKKSKAGQKACQLVLQTINEFWENVDYTVAKLAQSGQHLDCSLPSVYLLDRVSVPRISSRRRNSLVMWMG